MSLLFRQKTVIDAGPVTGITITKDFSTNDLTTIADSDESLQARINIPQGGQLSVGFNSIDLSQCLVFNFSQPCALYMVNDQGDTSQPIACNANRLSIFHCQLRGLTIVNTGTAPLEGILYLIGD